jgi:hypothetical protein
LAARGITSPSAWAKEVGAEKLPIIAKHRYVFFTGSPMQKRKIRKQILWTVSTEYPKGDTQRHEAVLNEQKQMSFL